MKSLKFLSKAYWRFCQTVGLAIVVIICLSTCSYSVDEPKPYQVLTAFYKIQINNGCSLYGLNGIRLKNEAKNFNQSDYSYYKMRWENQCGRINK